MNLRDGGSLALQFAKLFLYFFERASPVGTLRGTTGEHKKEANLRHKFFFAFVSVCWQALVFQTELDQQTPDSQGYQKSDILFPASANLVNFSVYVTCNHVAERHWMAADGGTRAADAG